MIEVDASSLHVPLARVPRSTNVRPEAFEIAENDISLASNSTVRDWFSILREPDDAAPALMPDAHVIATHRISRSLPDCTSTPP